MTEPVSAGPRNRPLVPYATALGVFGAAVVGFLSWARARRRLPGRVSAPDTLLLGFATHKIARLIATEPVTRPLRAPFVSEEQKPTGETVEVTAGRGARRALGELVTCPYCLAPWVAAGFLAAHSLSPRRTRFVAGTFAAVAVSDFANRLYATLTKVERRAAAEARLLEQVG
jgi:hypothetical protein